MRRQPSRALRVAVEATKVVTAAAIVWLGVGPVLVEAQTVTSGPAGPTQRTETADPAGAVAGPRLDALMERHGCSPTGLGPDVVPGSALVAHGGRLAHVSFDAGWAVFTGDAAGSLVAVCEAALPPAPSPLDG
jgi:hypothetical protein